LATRAKCAAADPTNRTIRDISVTTFDASPRAATLRLSLSRTLSSLARHLVLGALLEDVSKRYRSYELVAHWVQGEFHHDVILKLPEDARAELGGRFLVVATNCNGGVKEIICFAELPDRSALWHHRCPDIPEFSGVLPPILGRETTVHWFDPCELLTPDARSELRPEFRQRQAGGGWQQVDLGAGGGCLPRRL
jgi:hypothetical protein